MITGFYLAVALATPLPQVWTVDDDGPADFSSIAKAVLSVSEGDVLLVQPGSYGAFTLDKSLAILAPAGATRPAVKGISTVDGASQCTLVGLSFEVLRLESVPGRVVIDDCKIAPASASWFSTYPVALSADHCGSVLVTRTTVNGPHAFGGDDVGSYYCAVTLVDSEAAFAGCTVAGGSGGDGSIELDDMQGGTGLRALSSNVTLAGTSVRGGTGASACGAIGCASCSASCGGPGGVGLWVEDSNVFVRGNAAHLIDGGSPGTPPEQPGISIQAVSSVLVESGVSVPDGIVSVGASILTPNPPEPFLTVTGDDAAGVRTVNLFGPSASPALLALSLVPDLVQLPGQVEGALWLQLSEILLVIPMVTQGQTIPATWQIAVPELPELAGLTGIFQALCPSFPGTLDPSVPLLTNAGQMVLH